VTGSKNGPEEPVESRSRSPIRWRCGNRPPMTGRARTARTLQVLVALFVLIYLVLPQLGTLGEVVRRLGDVNVFFLLLGTGFEAASLVCYSQLTKRALHPSDLQVSTLTRIQLATKAVTNVVPGGSAAGSALGYRLLTLAGVEPTTAGFALASAGLGSAVVLNMLLWFTLFVSIPFAGVDPVYVTTALVGVVVLGAFFGLIIALFRGADRAERIVRRVAAKFSFLDPDRAAHVIQRIVSRVTILIRDPKLLRGLVGWAMLNWLLDAVALWVFLRAFGVSVRPDVLLIVFCVANISAAIPLTPGGLGVIEFALTSLLVTFGVPKGAASIAVPAYRLAAFWLPIPLGVAVYFTLRTGPWRIDRNQILTSLRNETGPVVNSGESVYDWADRVTEPPPDRVVAAARAAAESGHIVVLADRAEPGTVRSTDVVPPSSAPRPSPNAPVD
jgi:putative heme transporter